jgi:hypothetical protein
VYITVYKRISDKLKEKFAQEYEYMTVYDVNLDKLREKIRTRVRVCIRETRTS